MPATRIRRRPKASTTALPGRLKPRKSPKQSRSRGLVDAVLEAASRILVSRGFEGLTMQEVATVAGVSPGSLYQYFPDKVSLVTQIIEAQSMRELQFQLEHMARLAPQDLDSVVAALVRSTLAFQKSEGALMRATLSAMPMVGHHPLLVERVRQAGDGLRALLEAHRERWPDADLDVVTHVLVNSIHSLTHDGILPRPATLDDDKLGGEIIRLVCSYLKALSSGRRP